MRAAIFTGIGQPLEIRNVPEPKAEPGGLILRVHYCGICGSDLHATQHGAFVVEPGTVLGHEFCGEIVESRAAGWKVGELVTAVPNNACNSCRASGLQECKDNLGILCPSNRISGYFPEVPGGFAEYVHVNASQALRIPKDVSSRNGATVEPLAVGLHAVEKGNVRLGDRVLVIGGGPIGLAVVAFAKLAGAYHVVVSEYAEVRRKTSLAFGATGLIDPSKEEVAQAFAKIAGGPPDVIFECVGIPNLLQECINLSAPRGRIVVVGVCMVEDRLTPMSGIFKEVNVQFVLGYGKPDWRLVLNLLDSKGIDPTPMITNVIGLEELPAEFEALRKPAGQIKLLVSPLQA